MVETVTNYLQYASAFFAFIAALLWLLSALVKLPKAIEVIDAGYFDEAKPKPSDDLDRLTQGLTRQSQLSAMAALAAGVAAILQRITSIMPVGN